MKRVRVTSIDGVVRDEKRDYRDDGATFKAYLYKNKIPFTYNLGRRYLPFNPA